MENFIIQTVFSAVIGGVLGGFVSFIFWKLKFQTKLKVDFYREVLEKLIGPFYLWLLYGKIKAADRRLSPEVPDDQRHLLIVYKKDEDKDLLNIIREHLHLAAGDKKLTEQIEEFIRCREFNFELLETRKRMFKVYQSMEEIYNDYSKKYRALIG